MRAGLCDALASRRRGRRVLAVSGCVLAFWGTHLPGCAARRDSAVPHPHADDPLGRLGWLAGGWVRSEGDTVNEEYWTVPRGGAMLGVSRTITHGRMTFYEFLRIESGPDGLRYLASPLGRTPPTAFAEVAAGDCRVVFENPDHDFPQCILYRREGNRLQVRIEGETGGRRRASEWEWRRIEFASDGGGGF